MKKTPQTTAKSAPSLAPAQVELIPASRFRRYPTNRHVSDETVANMALSIREHGVIQPILARPVEDDGTNELEIIFGETRWKGCRKIDADYPVPCFVRELTNKEAARIHAIENFERKDLTIIEEGLEFRNMAAQGWQTIEIMEYLNRSKDYIHQRLALLRLPEDGKTALLENNLSINTAMKILMLPEEKQPDAIRACVQPTHAARALPEREAIQLVQRDYLDPLEKAKEWEMKKTLLLKENPGAEWMDYDAAKAAGNHASKLEAAGARPDWSYLSEAAKNDEVPIPTWGELAAKHGAKIYIGLAPYAEHTVLYVDAELIETAEIAACDATPDQCVFRHEKAARIDRVSSERKKLEIQAQMEALAAERLKFARLVMAPAGISKSATRKLVDLLTDHLRDQNLFPDCASLFDLPDDGELESADALDAAIAKYIHHRDFQTFWEPVARLIAACELNSAYDPRLAPNAAITTGAVKESAYPAFAKFLAEFDNPKTDDDDDETDD